MARALAAGRDGVGTTAESLSSPDDLQAGGRETGPGVSFKTSKSIPQ